MAKKGSDMGDLTMKEAGKRGGDATYAKHGLPHYQKIGKKGGEAVRKLIQAGKERENSA